MKEYSRTANVIDAVLAGCLPVINVMGNYRNLKSTLEQRIALCYSLARARSLVLEIEEEAEDLIMPYHEYVINELQYERRLALAGTMANLNDKFEEWILQEWSKSILPRYGTEFAQHFFPTLVQIRTERTR